MKPNETCWKCPFILPRQFSYKFIYLWCIQGISYWSVQSKSVLRVRRIHNFIKLWCLVALGGLEIWVSSASFQKSNIGWPQQPPTDMVFHDSTKENIFFQNVKVKPNSRTQDNTEVLGSDFTGLRTSATPVTSTASTTSVASMTSTASFHQKLYWTWWLDHPQHPNYQ